MTCAKFVTCEKDTFISLLLPDEAACIDFFQQTYADEHGSILDIIAAVEGGTVNYDAKAGYKCIQEQEAYTCEEFGKRDPEICQEVFTGTIAEGDACELHPECLSGYCDTTQDCPGVCTPKVSVGQACDLDAECEPFTRCVRDTCQRWTGSLASGDDCDPGDDDWCAEGLFCHEDLEVCETQVAIGDPCEAAGGSECVFGAICVGDGEGNTTCVELTIEESQDAVCDNRMGIMCAMYAGLSCRIDNFEELTGTCVPSPGPGDTCFEAGQEMAMTQCSFFDMLYCDVPPDYQSDGSCVPLKEDGDPCTGDDCLGSCNQVNFCESDSDTVCP
jgi:hypothetical protein